MDTDNRSRLEVASDARGFGPGNDSGTYRVPLFPRAQRRAQRRRAYHGCRPAAAAGSKSIVKSRNKIKWPDKLMSGQVSVSRWAGRWLLPKTLRFGSVIPIWIGTPSPKLRPIPKILAPHGHSFSLIALAGASHSTCTKTCTKTPSQLRSLFPNRLQIRRAWFQNARGAAARDFGWEPMVPIIGRNSPQRAMTAAAT